jgi:hypothetical protein
MSEVALGMAKIVGVAAGVGYAAKQIYDFGRAGAELEFTRTRFDRLAESIGTTSDALLEDLHTATRGMYSDSELLASAGNLMALGLAKTHDEAVRLATVSGGLNMNMRTKHDVFCPYKASAIKIQKIQRVAKKTD